MNNIIEYFLLKEKTEYRHYTLMKCKYYNLLYYIDIINEKRYNRGIYVFI